MLKYCLLNERAKMPTKREGDAGWDIHGQLPDEMIFAAIFPNEVIVLDTGIASIIDNNTYLKVENKSSIGSKGLICTAGIVDASYRGEHHVPLANVGSKIVILYHGNEMSDLDLIKIGQCIGEEYDMEIDCVNLDAKAITQEILSVINNCEAEEIDYKELQENETERGSGWCGSTDK